MAKTNKGSMEKESIFNSITEEVETRARQLAKPHVTKAFWRDGVVCIRGLFNESELDWCREGIAQNMEHPSVRAHIASGSQDQGVFLEDFCNWQRFDGYKQLIYSSPAAVVAGLLMGSNVVRLFHEHLLVKEAFTKQKTPWHQDQPYYNVDGNQNCSVWLPVDSVPRKSSLEFVAGSHMGRWLMPRTFLSKEAKWFPKGTLEEVPDIEANRSNFNILNWELEPGDAVFFHMLTLHSANGAGHQKRRALSIRFLGDDIIYAPRLWKTSPNFPGLEEELSPGSPLLHPMFPVLWRSF